MKKKHNKYLFQYKPIPEQKKKFNFLLYFWFSLPPSSFPSSSPLSNLSLKHFKYLSWTLQSFFSKKKNSHNNNNSKFFSNLDNFSLPVFSFLTFDIYMLNRQKKLKISRHHKNISFKMTMIIIIIKVP